MSIISNLTDRMTEYYYRLRTLCDRGFDYKDEVALMEEAISTIKELSEKLHAAQMERSSQYYNNGWIPCEEQMPEEQLSGFAKFKGTSKWNNCMFEKISDNVLATIIYDDGFKVSLAYTIDGEWKYEYKGFFKNEKIVAWMPLPDPYKIKENEK